MRPALLLTAIFAGCLNFAALAEANDRHGHGSHSGRGSAHRSFGQSSFSHPSFGQHSFQHRRFAGRPGFGPMRHPQRFADFGAPRWFGPPAGRLGTMHRRSHFGFAQPRSAFGFRPPVHRFVGPGRSFVGPHMHPFQPFVFAGPHPFRPFPGPRFGFRHDGFGFPHDGFGFPHDRFGFPHDGFGFGHDGFGSFHRRDGLTIVFRDAAWGPRW
jgi:hypothetical protein